MNIGIVTVAYNRKSSLSRLLDSLNAAFYDEAVDLIISIDKSNTDEVELFADDFVWQHGQKRVIKHAQNLGLKKHILGLGALFDTYDALVILEDDLIVSRHFYSYTKQASERYYSDDRVAGVSLYSYHINYVNYLPFHPIDDGYSTYFVQCASSWGEVWLKKQWLEFYNWYKSHEDFDYSPDIPENIFRWGTKSWLRYHTRYCVECDKYFVFPRVSLTTNFCDVGANHKSNRFNNPTVYQVPLQYGDNDITYLFPKLEDGTKYDVFFENQNLYNVLGMSLNDCCIDLYGKKNRNRDQRYWLTTSRQNYKIVKSFGLYLRPFEANVLKGIKGEGIYLYDTNVTCKNNLSRYSNLIPYHYRISNLPNFVVQYGIGRLIGEFWVQAWKKTLRILGVR